MLNNVVTFKSGLEVT